jgi:hypothetical protein
MKKMNVKNVKLYVFYQLVQNFLNYSELSVRWIFYSNVISCIELLPKVCLK